MVGTLQEAPQNIRFLCTSRHLGDIQELFAEASRLDIRANDGDITDYLNVHIQQVPKLVRFCCISPGLQTAIVKKLVEKANGMSVLLLPSGMIPLLT